MAQQTKIKTLKMMYSGNLEHITCPIKAKYEECIEIAREHFEIPTEFRNHIQISNGSRYIFEKYTFDYFNLLFPSPEIIFHIKIDYSGALSSMDADKRTPFTNMHNKRRNSEEHEGVPVTRQNCFIGSIAGNDLSFETQHPQSKRQRFIVLKPRRDAKSLSSRKSLRI